MSAVVAIPCAIVLWFSALAQYPKTTLLLTVAFWYWLFS